MASVTILRELSRHRLLVCLAFVVALVAGWLLAFGASVPPKSRGYTVGVATANVLVDTPKSQIVEIDPAGSDTLSARANVLASLMVDGDIKDAIARRVNLPSKKIVAWAGTGDGTGPATPLTASSTAYSTSVVLTSDMAELPIIRVTTQAPDVRQAITLANAAVEGLGSYLDTRANDETISDRRRLQVRALGTAQGHPASRGPGKKVGLAVIFFVFLAGCAVILAISALSRGWRAAVAAENAEPDDRSLDLLEWEHVAPAADGAAGDDAPDDWPVWDEPSELRTGP